MEVSETKSKSLNLKKVLKLSILGLLFFFILLLVYEFIRITPREVHFSNVTSSSITVSWNTKSAIPGTVIAKEGSGGFINLFGLGKEKFYDTRDVTKAELKAVEETTKNLANSDSMSINMSQVETDIKVDDKGKYYTHHVVVKGLNPETEYSFMVGDLLLFRQIEGVDKTENARTTVLANSISTPVPAYGNIKDAMGTDIPFDQLVPIDDGIVYLKFVDTLTGTKSKPLSGVLNSDGNWYIDISGAVDGGENKFFEKYDTVDGNVIAELLIDAGALGTWRKDTNAYILTPASDTVLNMPNAITDENMMESVYRIDVKEASVKGVNNEVFATLIIKDEACELNGLGTWSGSTCKCVANATLNTSTGVCSCNSNYEKIGGSCVLKTSECKCACPSGYTTRGCTGESCESKTGTCSPTGCDTPPTCYREVCEGCSCYKPCPSTHPLSYCPPEANGNCDTTTVTCTNVDSCDKTCGGTTSRTCYKPKDQDPVVNGNCGNNRGDYRAVATTWRGTEEGNWCTAGTPLETPSSFLTQQKPYATWKCKGLNGGSTVTCNATLLGSTPTCGGKTAGTNTTKDCTIYNTYNCSDCYYIRDFDYNCDPIYQKCTAQCNYDAAPAGLNCTSDPNKADPETSTCAGGAKLGQCTYVSGEGCKVCTWGEWNGDGAGYSSKWVKQGESSTACGDIKLQHVFDCPGYSEAKNKCITSKPAGVWSVDNTCKCSPYISDGNGGCKCTGGNEWSVEQGKCVVKSVSCNGNNIGVDCKTTTGRDGQCSSDTTIAYKCIVPGDSCGYQKKWSETGLCESTNTPIPEVKCDSTNKLQTCKTSSGKAGLCSTNPIGTCFILGDKCPNNSEKVWNSQGQCVLVDTQCKIGDLKVIGVDLLVCNKDHEYVEVDSICDESDNRDYIWNRSGYCVSGSCKNGYLEDPTTKTCKPNSSTACYLSTSSLMATYRDGKLYRCENKKFVLASDLWTLGNACKDFTLSPSNKSCNFGSDYYCQVDGSGTFGCYQGVWTHISNIPDVDDDEIIAGYIPEIEKNSQCTGTEVANGNSKCMCPSLPRSNKMINVGQWCYSVSYCEKKDAEDSSVCNILGHRCEEIEGMYAPEYVCRLKSESNLPSISVGSQCSNPKCQCPDGEEVNKGEYCKEISRSECTKNTNLNAICSKTSSCKFGDCNGDPEVTYVKGEKPISGGEKCVHSDEEKEMYDTTKCECTPTFEPGSKYSVSQGDWCKNVYGASTCTKEGEICDKDGSTCVKSGSTFTCKGATKEEKGINAGSICSYDKCVCQTGIDAGKEINEEEYCRQIKVSQCEYGGYDENLNQICSNKYSCKYKSCSGDPNVEYLPGKIDVDSGEKCTYTNDQKNVYRLALCTCKVDWSTELQLVADGYWCKEVYNYEKCTKTGQICDSNGSTCKLNDSGKFRCNGPVKSSVLDNKFQSLLSQVLGTSKVYADSIKNSQYIIDSQTGMFTGLKDGEYSFKYKDKYYAFTIKQGQSDVLLYIDENSDGKYQEGTDIKVSDLASTVEIVANELKYNYRLEQGYNFVSFPFLISEDEYRNAAGLVELLNEVYGDIIYSISKFDGSWKVVGQNVETYDTDNFQLIPGQGYLIKAKKDISISIFGQPVKFEDASDSAPVALFKGWNLVGIYGTGVKQYTAKSMLQDINAYKKVDFIADNVSKWDSEVQMYQGLQLVTTDGVESEYGFDYPINQLDSYFIRVQDGKGNWQPELAK